MTCIAAIIDREAPAAWMMGDTQRTSDTIISGERGPKITQMIIGGHACLVGQAGTARAMQLIWHTDTFPNDPCDREALPGYLISKWVPALRSLLADNGQIATSCPGNFEEAKNQLIIAFPGKLFIIGNGFEVGETIAWPYDAIGEGAKYVLASLCTTQGKGSDPQECLQEALRVASVHSTVVSGPFTPFELKG